MSDLIMVDEAFPPQVHAADILLVYSGGDTPHTWTKTETLSQRARYRLPTYVRSNPQSVSASSDISNFLGWLKAVGCPQGSTVCLDLETAVDAAYVNAFNQGMTRDGYPVMKYGSKSSIWNNPKTSGGTFVADPTGSPHMSTVGDTVATQYLFAGPYDLSLVKASVKLWDVHGSPSPPPPPAPGKEATVQLTLPYLQQGSTDSAATGRKVGRVQAMLNYLQGSRLAEDGIFGISTKGAVQTFQHSRGLTADGVVGPLTYEKLYQG